MSDQSSNCQSYRLEIADTALHERFSLVQDLIAISHADGTVTLSVKIEKSSDNAVDVEMYLRAHNHEAHDTMQYCQNKIAKIAERYGASVKLV